MQRWPVHVLPMPLGEMQEGVVLQVTEKEPMGKPNNAVGLHEWEYFLIAASLGGSWPEVRDLWLEPELHYRFHRSGDGVGVSHLGNQNPEMDLDRYRWKTPRRTSSTVLREVSDSRGAMKRPRSPPLPFSPKYPPSKKYFFFSNQAPKNFWNPLKRQKNSFLLSSLFRTIPEKLFLPIFLPSLKFSFKFSWNQVSLNPDKQMDPPIHTKTTNRCPQRQLKMEIQPYNKKWETNKL